MNLFYCPEILSTNYLKDKEAAHCINALRLKINDNIFITDGIGNLHTAKIINISNKMVFINIINTENNYAALPYHLHIAISITKNSDRIEYFAEKTTEIGISEISFINCRHSERKNINIERIKRIVEAAMKQSYKAFHPKINKITNYKDFMNNNFTEKHKFIAHCHSDKKSFLGNNIIKNSSYLIIIGPEGDFSEEEINIAKENNFIPVSLGNARLRTETAAIYTSSIISVINNL